MKDIFETNGLRSVVTSTPQGHNKLDIASDLVRRAQQGDFITNDNDNQRYKGFHNFLSNAIGQANALPPSSLPIFYEQYKLSEQERVEINAAAQKDLDDQLAVLRQAGDYHTQIQDLFTEHTLMNFNFNGENYFITREGAWDYYPFVDQVNANERNSFVQLSSGGTGIAGHSYPGHLYEINGQKFGQVRNPPRRLPEGVGKAYFCAVSDSKCTAMINMVEDKNGYQVLKKGEKMKVDSTTVECISEEEESRLVTSYSGNQDNVTLRKAKYRITNADGTVKVLDYVGFKEFSDYALGNDRTADKVQRHTKYLKDMSELTAHAIDYLDEQHALDGRVMTNCSEGQNRSNFMNTAIAYRKAIHNQIDAIVQAYPGDLARQNQEIAKLQTFLQTEVAHGTSPGYTNAHVLAEGLRAQIELNARISSKQRDQVLAFATHQTGHIIEHYVAKVRAQGLEETKAEDKSAEFAQHAGPLRAASPVRAASPTQDGGRAAGAASPISPRVTPVNEAVNLMLIALRDGNPTKEDLLGIVNLMPPEEQEGIRVLVEHSPPESLISNLERTARQSPSSPQTRSPSPSDTKSVANEEAGMERAIIQHLYNRFNTSRYLNSGVEDRERRGEYLQTLINQTELSEQRKGELILQLGAMETGQEVMQVFGQLGAVQRERAPFVATFRPVTPESKDQEGVSDGYRLLIKSMRDQATLLATDSITEEQFENALQDLLKSHSALITPEEKKDLESLLKHQESNELRKIMHNKLDEIKSLAATYRAVRDFRDGTEGHGYAAGFGPSPSPSSSRSSSPSSGRSNGSGGCSIQ